MNKDKEVICVLGMHRSGTSMLARMINMLGVSLGGGDEMIPPGPDNPKGFWEHSGIVSINENVLKSLGRTWDTAAPMEEKWWNYGGIESFKRKIEDTVIYETDKYTVWGWKDPRTCLLLPLWKNAIESLDYRIQYLLVYRNPIQVAKSLNKRDGLDFISSISLWLLYNLSALYWTRFSNIHVINYDDVIKHPKDFISILCTQVGLEKPTKETEESILDFVSPPNGAEDKYEDEMLKLHTSTLVNEVSGLLSEMALNTRGNVKNIGGSARIEALYERFLKYNYAVSGDRVGFVFQVYLGNGEAYEEKDSKTFRSRNTSEFQNYEVIFDCNGEKKRGNLRIDPSDIPGFIEISEIHLKYLDCQQNIVSEELYDSRNDFSGVRQSGDAMIIGRERNLYILSLGSDPQIVISGLSDFEDVCQLCVEIRLKVQPSNNFKYARSITDEYLGLRNEYHRITNECHQLRNDCQQRTDECHQLRDDCQQLKDECRKFEDEYRKLEDGYRSVMSENKIAGQRINQLEKQSADYRKNLEEKDIKIQELKTLNLELRGNIQGLNVQQEEMQLEIIRKSNTILRMTDSYSWKMTLPLRRLGGFLRGRRNISE